ncbi:hypothetical protein EON64_07830 [archaeon]|nr:MAG: hypothetical protein EON64_07830 [archaeon]
MFPIIPAGFETSSHPIFSKFAPPAVFTQQLSNGIDSANCSALGAMAHGDLAGREASDKLLSPTATPSADSAHSCIVSEPVATTANEQQSGHCVICLSAYEEPVTLVQCHHSFCLACARQWFLTVKRPRCPLCQTEHVHFIKHVGKTKAARLELWSAKSVGTAGIDSWQASRSSAVSDSTWTNSFPSFIYVYLYMYNRQALRSTSRT